MQQVAKATYASGDFSRNTVADWMEEHVTLRGQVVEVMKFAEKYVKSVRLAKGFDAVSMVVAILTTDYVRCRIQRPRGEGPRELEKLELFTNLLLKEMELEAGLTVYTQLFFDMALFGRGTVQLLPAKDYHDVYARDGEEAAAAYGCAPFKLERIDPRTWYPFPDEWAPQEGLIISQKPAYWAADRYGLSVTGKGNKRKIEKLGAGRAHVGAGVTHIEWIEYWTPKGVAYFVDGTYVDMVPHNYGEVLEKAGIPNRVPFFSAAGITGSGSDPVLQGMPMLYPVRDLLPFLSSLLNLLATAAVVNIGRMVHYGPGKDVPENAAVDLRKAQEEMGFQVEATMNMEKYELVQGASNFGLLQVVQYIERMIDEATVPAVLRGSMPPSGTSATLNREVYASAFARFQQMNENGNKLYWQIVRAIWAFIEDFEYPVAVYAGKKKKNVGQDGFVRIKPEDINGWRLVDVLSDTGLPNNKMIKARFAFENWQKGVGLHRTAAEAADVDDYDGFLGDKMQEDVVMRGFPLAVDQLFKQAFPAAAEAAAQIIDPKTGLPYPPTNQMVKPAGGPEIQDQTAMPGNQGQVVEDQSMARGDQEQEEAMYA